MEKLKAILKPVSKWFLSHWRTLVLFILAYAIAVQPEYSFVDAFALPIAWTLVASSLTLLTRKIMFDKIDLDKYAKDAMTNKNVGSGLVFVGVVILMATLLFCATEIMKAPFISGH